MKYTFDWKEYAKVAREVIAEGCVLIRNEENALPIKENETVSVFGRIQFDYYKSGTGSGGMVNAPYVVSILDALKENKTIHINEDLLQTYTEWVKKNPFDQGQGWASEPWCQEEMPITMQLAQEAAKQSDLALVIIGRTAGEDKDNSNTEGSYLLTQKEEQMLEIVCKAFKRVAVVLNVGNIMDMKFVDKYKPQAVLYAWQGGMEGGNGTVDVLTGAVNPSGKLSDTIAYSIEDYPSTAYFGDPKQNIYHEDIYVGYRYFETAAKEKVQYPFGYGLSYTTFSYVVTSFEVKENTIETAVTVKNTGDRAGKEVIQLFYCPPQGNLCKPTKNLIRFEKTKLLQPNEEQTLFFTMEMNEMASFDDSGATGHPFCYVLEKGTYEIYAGTNVRECVQAGKVDRVKDTVTEQLQEACAPVKAFNRLKLIVAADGSVKEVEEPTPLRTVDISKRIKDNQPESLICTGDKGYRFIDVIKGNVSDMDYLNQLRDEDLIAMSRGEGMCSTKVTPGIAGSFGGVTDTLESFGMPIEGCSDGPSGIRMDCGTKAFALPNGTLIACTYNYELVKKMYEWEGMELRKNKIEALLGPGMNIHRNPLNGRNFEYLSEDPYLTGKMACAMLKGMQKYGIAGTIKHFAANNQESMRHFTEGVVSQRALREIYLKGFEMAVKEGHAMTIMTTYGPVNGFWTAGYYDLNTTILRGEWGYKGLVMTDWWARINEEGKESSLTQTTCMVRAQNDVYMVVADAKTNTGKDDTAQGLKEGRITRGELLRNANNILYVLKNSLTAKRLLEGEDEITEINRPNDNQREKNIMKAITVKGTGITKLDLTGLDTSAGSDNQFSLHIPEKGYYELKMKMKSSLGELAQMSMSIFTNNTLWHTITINGTDGKWIEKTALFQAYISIDIFVDLYFAQSGIDMGEILVEKKYTIEEYEKKFGVLR